MVKSFLLFTITLAVSNSLYSQTTLFIKSSNDNSPLIFASISNISTKSSFSTNDAGIAKIKATNGDTLLITYVGYIDQKIIVGKDHNHDTIILKRAEKSLKEIYVKSCKKYKDLLISNADSGKTIGGFSGVMCTKGNYNGKVAVKIQNGKEYAKLKSISFWLKKMWHFSPPYAIQSPLIISFYSISDLNLPGYLLYQNPLIYFPKKVGKQELKVDSIGVKVPPEGIFICIEFVMDEKYQWEQKVNDTIQINQGVLIDGVYSNGFELSFFDYQSNCWIKPRSENTQDPNRKHGTIRIEAKLKYCK